MEAKRILLVEDDPKDIELTLLALEDHNLRNEIAVARNGIEALDYLYRRGHWENRDEGSPLLILLDLKMPKVNGLETLRVIKEDPALQAIPIVALTTSRADQDLSECYRMGVNAYVVKPVIFEKFIDAIKEVGLFWVVINEPPAGSVGKV